MEAILKALFPRKINRLSRLSSWPKPGRRSTVSWHLDPVQHRAGPLVEPPPALPAPEAPKTMNRSPLPLGGRRRVAVRAVHGGSLDRSKRAREPIRWGCSRQATLRSDRTIMIKAFSRKAYDCGRPPSPDHGRATPTALICLQEVAFYRRHRRSS
jgi:hypothetical protein